MVSWYLGILGITNLHYRFYPGKGTEERGKFSVLLRKMGIWAIAL